MKSEACVIALGVLKKLVEKIDEDELYYYFDEILVDKQELKNEYDSQMVDDICEELEYLTNLFLAERGLFGRVDNGYNEVIILR